MSSISVAFRFHINFYHSYRGDSLEEHGIGKDIRIIRHLIASLDELNAAGTPVRGTWDAENLFSLERMIPESAPDILDGLTRRSSAGLDEIEIMSYNNGLIPAHTRTELKAAVRRAVGNEQGSGVADLFSRFRTIMRPQEMMWTPSLLEIYPALDVEAVSLYASRIPFNTYGSFVAELPLEQQFNPLRLTASQTSTSIPMIPAVNHGDIVDFLSLRRMLRTLRRRQMRECPDRDLLVLVDMDADDEFWVGFDIPVVRRMTTASGFSAIVRSIRELPFVRFTTPGAYLDEHPPQESLSLDMDTADGSFDGYASWAEKWENHRTYAILDGARRRAWAFAPDAGFEMRLQALSTTHFGLAAPVMNASRLADAMRIATAAFDSCAAPAPPASVKRAPGDARVALYPLGGAHGDVPDRVARLIAAAYPDHPTLRFIPLACAPNGLSNGELTPVRCVWAGEARRVGREAEGVALRNWTVGAPDSARGDMAIVVDGRGVTKTSGPPVACVCSAHGVESITSTDAELTFRDGRLVALSANGIQVAGVPLLAGSLTYRGRRIGERQRSVEHWSSEAGIAVRYELADLSIAGGATLERRFVVANDVPGFVLETRLAVPELHAHGVSATRRACLERTYDSRLSEIRPAELKPDLRGRPGRGFSVWRQSYLGEPLSFSIPYEDANNRRIDSSNNAITQSWIAVSDGDRGLLVAQGPIGARSFAFCPLRVTRSGAGYAVRMNPFGSYWGKQLSSPAAQTGLGRLASLLMADHIKPLAPSYAGREHHFAILVVPFAGDAPPEELQERAWLFSHPPELVPDAAGI